MIARAWTIAQTAFGRWAFDPKTVADVGGAVALRGLRRSRGRAAVSLIPFRPRITRLLDTHPYSAQQIFQRLREEGYRGGVTILRDYVCRIRPTNRPVYLKPHLRSRRARAGRLGVPIWEPSRWGNTWPPASRFSSWCWRLAAKCSWSLQSPKPWRIFLACHEHGFAALGGVPSKIMVDNLKSAVLQRLAGAVPVFNPRYLDFARHHGFAIAALVMLARGNEKGRVESVQWDTSKRISCMGSS